MNKFNRSVFLKLMLVFIFSGAASVGTFAAFSYWINHDRVKKNHRAKHWVRYGQMLATELGPTPDMRQIQRLKEDLHLIVRFESPGQTLMSDTGAPTFTEVDAFKKIFHVGDHFKFGRYKNLLAIQIFNPPARYLFILEQDDSSLAERPELIVGVTGAILIILLFTFLSVRRILKPLVILEAGVNEIAKGNLNKVIGVEGHDEQARLAGAINVMTGQVRSMIQSKEQLLLDVSHEFRSPLTRIKVALEIGDEDSRRSIKNSVMELENMVTEILESARLNDAQGKLQLQKINIVELLRTLVEDYVHSPVGIQLYREREDIMVSADRARLQLAFKNLLENAVKYSSQQSRPVEIDVRQIDDVRVSVSFTDYGVGIPQADLSLIFEPFYRVDRSRVKSTGGYGLGLSLSKKIIIAHGAQISVRSIPHVNTIFTIILHK